MQLPSFAYFSRGQHADAVEAYRKALEIDPSNASYRSSLQIAESRLKSQQSSASAAAPTPTGAVPAGDFGSLLSNPAVQSLAQNLGLFPGAGGAGGAGVGAAARPAANPFAAGGLQDVLNNPELVNVASSMMQQPGFADMLNNPSIINMYVELFCLL